VLAAQQLDLLPLAQNEIFAGSWIRLPVGF
jgi:hypothetical protein